MEIYYSFVSLYRSGFGAPRSAWSAVFPAHLDFLVRPARTTDYSQFSWAYFKNTLRKFLSACSKYNFSIGRGRISNLLMKNPCHSSNTWVSAKISQGQFRRTAPGFHFPPFKIYSTLLHFLFSEWHHMLCHNP